MTKTYNNKGEIKIYPYQDLGYIKHGWLDTRHHFSFGNYHNLNRIHFGALRVINDDIIASHKGFDFHPHKDMEIITYVRQGAIIHEDNIGNKGRTSAGNIQVMSAGTGIVHSEYNGEEKETILYQIWISPNKLGVTPRWDTKEFSNTLAKNKLHIVVSGRSEDMNQEGLFIYQDATIYWGTLLVGKVISCPIKYQAYILLPEGEVLINNVLLKKGDGAEITNTKNIIIEAKTLAEVLIIDVP